MNKGSLVHEDYFNLFKNNNINYNKYTSSQIQPSSVDLTLSDECYEIKASFLSPSTNVRDKLENIINNKIDLNETYVFKKNISYLVRLNEKLNLNNDIFGKCNPKSSTGRLDIFCRAILNFSDEYEKIPINYNGEIFLEITSRSFNIALKKGDSLNQMRLIYQNHEYVDDESLNNFHEIDPIIFDEFGNKNLANISSGLKISVDLKNINKISAYIAKDNTPVLHYNKIYSHKVSDFWDSIKTKDNSFIIKTGKFYILRSKQKIRIPKIMAGEMIPYDTGIGDFRVHYAGFFDPGFGDPFGSYAVLEVKTNEVPFILHDDQVIAKIQYEKLNKETKVVYGSNINSNYQNQALALSKHFETLTN